MKSKQKKEFEKAGKNKSSLNTQQEVRQLRCTKSKRGNKNSHCGDKIETIPKKMPNGAKYRAKRNEQKKQRMPEEKC